MITVPFMNAAQKLIMSKISESPNDALSAVQFCISD